MFPADQQTLRRMKLAFHSITGFPNVVGAIDSSYIAVKTPSLYEEVFVNRNIGVHSINIQAVCNPDMQIINLVAKWPGSMHDSFIWRSSSLHTVFERNDIKGWLLGE